MCTSLIRRVRRHLPGRRLRWVWSAMVIIVACILAPSSQAAQPQGAKTTPATPAPATEVTNSPVAAIGVATMENLDDVYKLAMGDRLSFRIVEDNEDSKQLMVLQSGGIELPYVGRFPAIGKTCRTLAREIKAELEKDYYHRATVIITVDELTRSRGRIYLFGAVRVPGPQEIPSDEVFTLSKAIMRAGGFADFANKRQVKVTRKVAGGDDKPKILVRNVGDVIEKGETKEDIDLEVGDIIYVPSRSVNF